MAFGDEVINRAALASTLRNMAALIEKNGVRVVSMEHQTWKHNNTETVTLKWENRESV